eukprot:SAG31_NODE_4349_length_3324_cov_6.508217_3_plen_485_part_00
MIRCYGLHRGWARPACAARPVFRFNAQRRARSGSVLRVATIRCRLRHCCQAPASAAELQLQAIGRAAGVVGSASKIRVDHVIINWDAARPSRRCWRRELPTLSLFQLIQASLVVELLGALRRRQPRTMARMVRAGQDDNTVEQMACPPEHGANPCVSDAPAKETDRDAATVLESAAKRLSSSTATVSDYIAAAEGFEEILRVDPGHAAARYGLEQARRAQIALAGNGAVDEAARLAAQAAAAINECTTVADYDSVLHDFGVALELDPASDLALYGHTQATKGRALLISIQASKSHCAGASVDVNSHTRFAKVKAKLQRSYAATKPSSQQHDQQQANLDAEQKVCSTLYPGSLAEFAERAQAQREEAAAAKTIQNLEAALIETDGAVFASRESLQITNSFSGRTGDQKASLAEIQQHLVNSTRLSKLEEICGAATNSRPGLDGDVGQEERVSQLLRMLEVELQGSPSLSVESTPVDTNILDENGR